MMLMCSCQARATSIARTPVSSFFLRRRKSQPRRHHRHRPRGGAPHQWSRRLWSSSAANTTARDANADATTSHDDAHEQQPVKSTFYVPKAERDRRSAFPIDCVVGHQTRMARDKRTSPARDLNFTHAQWERHKNPWRKIRHMTNLFRAANFQRLLFPDLFGITAISGALIYYNQVVVVAAAAAESSSTAAIGMSPLAFAGATTAIGLLAGFRLNAGYARYREGRAQWGVINTATRDLARQSLMWIKHKNNNHNHNHNNSNIQNSNNNNAADTADANADGSSNAVGELQIAQTRMLRFCQAFPVALLFRISDKGGHHDMARKSKDGQAPFQERVMAEFREELKDIYHHQNNNNNTDNREMNDILNDDFERILRVKAQGGSAPLEILTCMAKIIDFCDDKGVHPIYLQQLDHHIHNLCQALGSSEGIIKTPLPTGFTRHSSRLLFIWSNCLPFALYPVVGPLGTMPASLLTAYAVLGIDMSVQLEEPFDILPLRQYSDGIFESVQAIERGFHK